MIDRGGQALYGPENAHLLKGIPEEFAAKVAVDGFEMSDPLIDENGGRRVLFGTALTGGRILYASVPTASMQKACGETTYLGEGYSYILGRDGKIVIPPVRYNYEQVYEDIGHLLIYADNPSDRVEMCIRDRYMAHIEAQTYPYPLSEVEECCLLYTSRCV